MRFSIFARNVLYFFYVQRKEQKEELKKYRLKFSKKFHKNRKDVKKNVIQLIYLFHYNLAQGLIQSVRSRENATGVMS